MPETIHCRVCGKAFRVKNFEDQMAKLRHHYKTAHPRIWKESVKRGAQKRRRRR